MIRPKGFRPHQAVPLVAPVNTDQRDVGQMDVPSAKPRMNCSAPRRAELAQSETEVPARLPDTTTTVGRRWLKDPSTNQNNTRHEIRFSAWRVWRVWICTCSSLFGCCCPLVRNLSSWSRVCRRRPKEQRAVTAAICSEEMDDLLMLIAAHSCKGALGCL